MTEEKGGILGKSDLLSISSPGFRLLHPRSAIGWDLSMASITFQVLDGIDKGRIFRDLETPVTIGREEGNLLRLNDERISRFHAKVQSDNDEVVITDLDSTNGTRVNGHVVQIRRLHPGDR
ncbi:MAG: FHA domain-containing protein, partial [Gemmataceae bacterium]